MKFIGQKTIMSQLGLILPELYNTSKGANILLRGPSGWGKTRMALLICNYLVGTNFQFQIGDKVPFNWGVRVHLIDEAHEIETPEIFYPIMDSGKYVLIFTTNDIATLPEAFSNRCIDFIFEPYTTDELKVIIEKNLWEPLDDLCLKTIIDAGGKNPRIVLSIIQRINLYQKSRERIKNVEKLKEVLENYLGIVNGLNEIQRRYLKELENLGGTSSLDSISMILHVNRDVLRNTIEPLLLHKGLIKITSRGRSLISHE
jgi:Holliday junction resolvasome RuvABC ATP-dependent DNA helicase subunit